LFSIKRCQKIIEEQEEEQLRQEQVERDSGGMVRKLTNKKIDLIESIRAAKEELDAMERKTRSVLQTAGKAEEGDVAKLLIEVGTKLQEVYGLQHV
jgi:hypothetical protein